MHVLFIRQMEKALKRFIKRNSILITIIYLQNANIVRQSNLYDECITFHHIFLYIFCDLISLKSKCKTKIQCEV